MNLTIFSRSQAGTAGAFRVSTRFLADEELRTMLGACAHARPIIGRCPVQPARDDLRAEERLQDYAWRGESRGGWAQVAMGAGIGLVLTAIMVIWGMLWL